MNNIENLPKIQIEHGVHCTRIHNAEDIKYWLRTNESSYHAALSAAKQMLLSEDQIDLFILMQYIYKCVQMEHLLIEAARNKPTVITVNKCSICKEFPCECF